MTQPIISGLFQTFSKIGLKLWPYNYGVQWQPKPYLSWYYYCISGQQTSKWGSKSSFVLGKCNYIQKRPSAFKNLKWWPLTFGIYVDNMPEYVCLALTPGPKGQIMENNKTNFFNDTELVSDRWVIWAQLDASTEMLKSPPKYIWIFLLKYPEYNEKKKIWKQQWCSSRNLFL